MLLTTWVPDDTNDLVCCYIHQKMETAKGYLISWTSSHVNPTWEIRRTSLHTSSVKRNRQLSSTRNIGVKSSVQSWEWKLITAGTIISSLSIPSNDQVSEYIYFGFYIHALNCIIVTMVLYFLWLSYFNDDIMLLTVLCNYYDSYASHI